MCSCKASYGHEYLSQWVLQWVIAGLLVMNTDSFNMQQIIHFSLVPRPFPPPVFDRLQYANTEGEGLGDFVTCSYNR